ncbi:MAG: hypothetical protein IT443_03815 [Phycisphaeraceae bacterium]|nr:hypothetical protein [Phycisphaeraceae bacterium]
MPRYLACLMGLLFGSLGGISFAEQATPLNSLSQLPIKEVTIFKDGHALLLHEGQMPVEAGGRVVMDYLPQPVLGTFWPYAAEPDAKLLSVTAAQRKVLVSRTALNLRELIEANVGADVWITEQVPATAPASPPPPPLTYPATILAIPTRTGEELEEISPPHSGQRLPEKGDVVLLKTETGVKALPIVRIIDLTFKDDPQAKLANEEFRNLLTLQLQWSDAKPHAQAQVGMLYLQRGIRWIPNYKVTIDGQGAATVTLQATILNEMADLNDVTAHLVVGVPTFAFKETIDPMALQQQTAQLGSYFQQDARTGYALRNAMLTQQARMTEVRHSDEAAAPPDLGPELAGSTKNEDLFIFTVEHLTLKKGQRLVLPVTTVTIPYQDVFTLNLPFAPPPEVRNNFNDSQRLEIERLFRSPKVMHTLRLNNTSATPLTTAPALIVRDDRALAQGMMTYAAPGAQTDLDLTTAVDVHVKKSDVETQRIPNAASWQGNSFGRSDLTGTLHVTNYRAQPVELEIVRHVLGNATEASHDGKIEQINTFEDETFYAPGSYPVWWPWYNWPHWWHHFNSVARIRWTIKLEPNQSIDLTYQWYYYWL